MVVLNLKYTGGDGFLYETTTNTPNTDLIASLVSIHNKRIQARLVIEGARGLAMYGVMKNPDQSDESDTYEKGEHFREDPSGLRTGNAPGPDAAKTLQQVAQDFEDFIDKSQVIRKKAMTEAELDDKLSNVRGAVMMAYPMGLPSWDTMKNFLGTIEDMQETHVANDILDPSDACLWVAGKDFVRGQLVSDRLGTNEKTKVIAKLQSSTNGAPAREPAVSEDERKAMMAYYFKKQEDMKKLAEADEDDYLNSAWADPKNMKRSLQGIGEVRAPGVSRF
uniref:Uncharacterized protein n=1 Tax=Leptocylindrus danicus TaxID=163516 RepID=A0A7S2PIW6_9STRA|mmetsp:Transcript_3760/g.5454  ORF Transcript_3760/g.5454 Transcript_3760/m.5454 type:complete len:278 (+) Transcript_3760:157-990(+)